MNASQFTQAVIELRAEHRGNIEEFIDALSDLDDFNTICTQIHEMTVSWAKAVGIGTPPKKPKKEEGAVPSNEAEALILEFFKGRDLHPESSRNYADLMDVLIQILRPDLEVNVHKFISIATYSKKFDLSDRNVFASSAIPRFLCLIPTGNSNSHSYPIGVPALYTPLNSLAHFYMENGSVGNNMTPSKTELAVPDLVEVSNCVGRLMYINSDIRVFLAQDFLS